MAPPALIEQVRRSLPGDLGSSAKFALIERSISQALDAGIAPDKIIGVFSSTGTVLDSATLDSLTDSARSITRQATSGSKSDTSKRISAALQARAAGTVQAPVDQPSPRISPRAATTAPSGLSITGFAQPPSLGFPRGSGSSVPNAGLYEAYSELVGGVLSPAEVAAAVESGSLDFQDVLSAVTKGAGGGGGGGGGGVAAAPVARFGFETIGGRIFRTNDLTGGLEDTGITAPGFSNVSVDRNGNLTGIDPQGNFQVIQPGYGFQQLSPQEEAAESRRRFDVGFAEDQRQFGVTQAEQNRRAALQAQTAGFQTVANLAPQLANVAQNQAQFQRDVVSSPADFLFRAFSTRGQQSPLPRVTQADFINGLSDEIAKYNQALQSFNPQAVGFQQPAPQAGFTAPAPQQAPSAQPRSTLGATYNYQTGQWEQGGAPINVLDAQNNLTNPEALPPVGFSSAPQSGVQAFTQEGPRAFTQPAPLVRPEDAAPATGFQVPQIPAPGRTTQSELRSLEQQYRPPAIQSILGGKMPSPLNLGFQLPTAQQYGALTPDERRAFGTTLAVQYDTTPEDVEFAIQRRFGQPQEQRRARVVGF